MARPAGDRKPPALGSYLQKILTARVYDVAHETPLEPARSLSKRLSNQVLLKREDSQPVFSFKLRGAYNKMAHLSTQQLERGVICASAGNHAQGVALAARKLGCKALVVMPVTTPRLKVDAVRSLGGDVVLHGARHRLLRQCPARHDEMHVDAGEDLRIRGGALRGDLDTAPGNLVTTALQDQHHVISSASSGTGQYRFHGPRREVAPTAIGGAVHRHQMAAAGLGHERHSGSGDPIDGAFHGRILCVPHERRASVANGRSLCIASREIERRRHGKDHRQYCSAAN